VYKQLKDIASVEGMKSQDHKKGMIMKLLAAAKDAEPGYIVRSLQGRLRIGLAEPSVLVALSHAVELQVLSTLLHISGVHCHNLPMPLSDSDA
jgi:DNA ligase 1